MFAGRRGKIAVHVVFVKTAHRLMRQFIAKTTHSLSNACSLVLFKLFATRQVECCFDRREKIPPTSESFTRLRQWLPRSSHAWNLRCCMKIKRLVKILLVFRGMLLCVIVLSTVRTHFVHLVHSDINITPYWSVMHVCCTNLWVNVLWT